MTTKSAVTEALDSEVGTLVVLKLSTGEEVVGKFETLNKHSVSLRTTFSLQYNLNNGQLGFGLIPWGVMAEDVKDINANMIVYSSKPNTTLSDAYASVTSPVVMPSKALITG